MARCPCHDDSTASLKIDDADDGKVLLHCHAGCSQQDIVDHLKAAGMWKANGTRPPPGVRPPAASKPVRAGLGKLVASYDYVDTDGALRFQVCRFEPKTFRQRRPDGDGWQWGMQGVELIPYRLPEVVEQVGKGLGVFAVEGEKDVDALRAIGCVATCNPQGAGKWRPEFARWFEGATVIVLPDNDDPGRRHAEQVRDMLAGSAAKVVILELPGLPDKGDVSDWIAAGGTKQDLSDLVKAALAGRLPEPPPRPVPAVSEPPPAAGIALWEDLGLAMTDKGQALNNLDNVVRAIEADPELRGRIWYDEFLDAIVTTWQGPQRQWKDADDVLLQLYMQRHVGLTKIGVQTCHDAALVAAFHATRNECKDWLAGLRWDGVNRLAHLMSEGFGAAEDAYTEAVGRCWVISMVARVMRPGCKVDTVPVLEGSQGAGKSSGLSILGGKWFVECHESVMSKDFYGVLQGHMLVEIAEMHSFTRAEVERIKGIISNQMDRYRKAYGRNTEDHPRQTVLVCTTNRDDWQKDDTGARRFWPVRCGKVDLDWLRHNREQVFAEAVQLYREGCSWWDVPAEQQAQEVDERRDVDAWESVIDAWLAGVDRPTTSEILSDCLKIELGRQDQMVQKRVARVMRVLGWRQHVTKIGARNVRAWVRNA